MRSRRAPVIERGLGSGWARQIGRCVRKRSQVLTSVRQQSQAAKVLVPLGKACLSGCHSIRPIYIIMSMFISIWVYLSDSLSHYLPIYLSICLSFNLSNYLPLSPLYPLIFLSIKVPTTRIALQNAAPVTKPTRDPTKYCADHEISEWLPLQIKTSGETCSKARCV